MLGGYCKLNMFENALRSIAKAMRMDDATWERHANPWSAYTRMATLPVILLAIWSRRWVGWYFLWWIGMLLVWNWWNPRAFPKPASTESWAAHAVRGEQLYLARGKAVCEPREARAVKGWTLLSLLGLPALVIGLKRYRWRPLLVGTLLVYGGKLAFLQIMVRISRRTSRSVE